MENIENVANVTASVRFQDADFDKGSFLKELEESCSVHDQDMADGDDGMNENVDVPDRITKRLGSKNVMDDLQRFSVHVGKQIMEGSSNGERFEGVLFVKSRTLFGRWKRYFGSIAIHNNFGPVLFLFSYHPKGGIRLKDSLMIVLSQANVKEARAQKDNFGFRIKTEKKKWYLACEDSTKRDHWVKELQLMADL